MKSRLVSVLIVICLFLAFALQLPLLAYAEEGKDLTMPYELSGGYEWEYIGQHMDYYTNSFSDDIVPMKEKIGLGMLLEDSQSDLSDTAYGLLDNAITMTDLPSMFDTVLNDHNYPINFTNEYSILIYQLMANEQIYSGMRSVFSNKLQKNILKLSKKIASGMVGLYSNGIASSDIPDQLEIAYAALDAADPGSVAFEEAWSEFAELSSQCFDLNRKMDFCDQLKSDIGDAGDILGGALDELKTIGEAYQYMCYAETYLEVSEEFKTVLDQLAATAYGKVRVRNPYKRVDTDPYGNDHQYYNLYSAIAAWTEKMDAYQKDAVAEFARDISTGTVGVSIDLLTDKAIDVILPGFGQIKAALSLGKLGIDLFTTVDDEYKQSLMVSCLDHITTLMIEVAEYYVPMIGTIDRDKTGDGTGREAWIKMTPYDQAVMFDESINIYKSAMKLACEYGTAYEQSKLNFATAIANGTASFDSFFATCLFYSEYWGNTTWWQEQASLSSSIIEALAVQKLELDKIQCHDEALLLKQEQEAAPGPSEKPTDDKVLLAVKEYDGNGELYEAVHFDYDKNGLISRSYHDSYSGGILTDWGYDYIYTYDEAGRLIPRYYYVDQWDSGFEDVIRSYDSNGFLASDNMYSEGEVSVEKEYAYDEGGRLIWEHAINGSPFLGGKVENEYSYSYHTDEQDQTVGVRHNETDPSIEDMEVIYNAAGQLIQGYKSELTYGTDGKIIYEYLDDPYFCIRDEFSTFSYPYDTEETRSTNIRYAIILDSAGQEIESFALGIPETAQMSYDDGYLVSVDNSNSFFQFRTEFIYGAPGEEPETSNTDTAQQLPPLSYVERTEHYDHVISGGILTGTSDLAYPYFTDDSPIAAMLNESIERVMDELRVTDVEMDEETEEFFKEVADQGLPPGLNDVEVTVTYNGSNLVSLLYRYSDYGSGAAHVYTRYEGHTYDIGACEELDYRDLAGLKYRQMNACYTREAAAKGVSRPLDQAEAYVLSADGLSVYCNVGYAVPREIITVPFTSEYFDRAPIDNKTTDSESTVSESDSSNQAMATTLTVTGNGVNIRSGPGTNYGSIGSVNAGDKLFSKGKSDNWYMVEYGNSTGYIIEDYVTIEHGGFYTAVDSGTLSVNGTDVNIRSGPGTEYQSIGTVSSGTTLTITGKSDNWYQVNYNGRKGYIIEDYVIRNN